MSLKVLERAMLSGPHFYHSTLLSKLHKDNIAAPQLNSLFCFSYPLAPFGRHGFSTTSPLRGSEAVASSRVESVRWGLAAAVPRLSLTYT